MQLPTQMAMSLRIPDLLKLLKAKLTKLLKPVAEKDFPRRKLKLHDAGQKRIKLSPKSNLKLQGKDKIGSIKCLQKSLAVIAS